MSYHDDLLGRRTSNIAANIARDKGNQRPPEAQKRNNRRNESHAEIMVAELLTSANGKHGGLHFSKLDTSKLGRSQRRMLRKRIRSINERRMRLLADGNPDRALMEEIKIARDRIAYLESR